MKTFFFFFTIINISASFFGNSCAQNIILSITAEKEISSEIQNKLKVTKLHQNTASLTKEANRVLSTFQQWGFLESKLNNISEGAPLHEAPEKKHYIATFYLGTQSKEVVIDIRSLNSNKKELPKIPNTTVTDSTITINFEDIDKLLTKINEKLSKEGDPFSKLRLSNFSKKNNKLFTTLITKKNFKRKIDSIIIKGYEKFPKSFLKYTVNIKRGQRFDIEELKQKNTLLNAIGFIKTTKPPEALFKKDKTYIYIYAEKQRYNNFDGILGFTTNETTQKLEFNGYLNLELNNNLNFGEQLSINYKADGGAQTNFSTQIELPYLFKSPLGLRARLQIFRKDSTFLTSNQHIASTYRLSPSISVFAGYQAETSSNLLDSETTASTIIEDYNTKSIITGVSYSKHTDNILFPTKTAINLDLKTGKRTTDTNNTNQLGATITASQLFELSSRNAIFLQNKSAYLNSDNYLENELYRFGGIQSIRGFDENNINASLYSAFQIEYRYILNTNLYAHSITDVAYFENKSQNIEDNLYSFGVGFGLKNGKNLLKFAYANGKLGNNSFKFSNSKIHISLISRF